MAPDEMTVAQMIEKLSAFPPDAMVALDWSIARSGEDIYIALETYDPAPGLRHLGALLEFQAGRPL